MDIVMRRIDDALARLDTATGSLLHAHDCVDAASAGGVDERRVRALEADNDRLRAAVAEAMGQIEGLISRIDNRAGGNDRSRQATGSPPA